MAVIYFIISTIYNNVGKSKTIKHFNEYQNEKLYG